MTRDREAPQVPAFAALAVGLALTVGGILLLAGNRVAGVVLVVASMPLDMMLVRARAARRQTRKTR